MRSISSEISRSATSSTRAETSSLRTLSVSRVATRRAICSMIASDTAALDGVAAPEGPTTAGPSPRYSARIAEKALASDVDVAASAAGRSGAASTAATLGGSGTAATRARVARPCRAARC